jgi:hypothetical protein
MKAYATRNAFVLVATGFMLIFWWPWRWGKYYKFGRKLSNTCYYFETPVFSLTILKRS